MSRLQEAKKDAMHKLQLRNRLPAEKTTRLCERSSKILVHSVVITSTSKETHVQLWELFTTMQKWEYRVLFVGNFAS